MPPIGEWDGEPREVPVHEMALESSCPISDEFREHMEELVWAFNYWLPFIPTNTEEWVRSYNLDGPWEFPEPDDPVWGFPFYDSYLVGTGDYVYTGNVGRTQTVSQFSRQDVTNVDSTFERH